MLNVWLLVTAPAGMVNVKRPSLLSMVPPAAPMVCSMAGSLAGAPTGVGTPTGVGMGLPGFAPVSFLQENKSTVNRTVHKVTVMRCMVK